MHMTVSMVIFCALSPLIESFFFFDVEKIFSFFRRVQVQETPMPELECPFRRLDPVIRSVFHSFHNDLRGKFAQGEFKLNGLTYEPANNTHEVEYDCDMEGMAERPDDFYEMKEFGINSAEISVPWKAQMVKLIRGVLQSWTETDALQNMIHQNATRIGCSYYMLPTTWSLRVICLYDNRPEIDELTAPYFGLRGAAMPHVLATVKNSSKTDEDDERNRNNNYFSRFL
ncbi:hypothetical protein Aduo_017495 [Ancylostoma duodenale]